MWSDAELGLRGPVYIPVNTTQLSALRNVYPNLEIVQSLPSTIDPQPTSTMPSSDSSTSIQSTNSNSSYQDYFSKIDQQIQSSKNSLQSLDIKDTYITYDLHLERAYFFF